LHTLLFDDRAGYQRLDVCEDCWSAHYAEGANHRKGFISHWQGTYTPPPPPPPDPIRRETAESLLRKLVELQDPRHAKVCFILAVMLERRRLLKVKAESAEAGQRILHYEHAKSGELFTISDPNLQLDQLEAVQQEVAQLLERGLVPPASEAGAGPGQPAPPDPPPGAPGGQPTLPTQP
jgi:hypothetical protein